ncbi:hypothetical protein ASPZODRAFT_126748 [Penicilliopsis zonata CBS 506.65]|uniref:Cofilin n=1 Tax=Penicilliopsis zonata CBS 506.65 TaxID=1073090 RepID=A0A1L9SUB9_9EURO|nr:hypothetical protein ASPZODRAFT_126748 [Penicilliopsis zonata CBS 506.65]OJJ50802.1 hypothetical protein ASPZODRAFT_126748 [Penicilliopsis zonata CBS 506.65]
MSLNSGVSINDECVTSYKEFSLSRGKTKYMIFKLSDDKSEIVIDESGGEKDYEVFRNKLCDAKDSKGRPAPRYAVYDVEYELGGGEGKRNKIIFISWVPEESDRMLRMIYASTREGLKTALGPAASIHADEKGDIEWNTVLYEASGGKAGK